MAQATHHAQLQGVHMLFSLIIDLISSRLTKASKSIKFKIWTAAIAWALTMIQAPLMLSGSLIVQIGLAIRFCAVSFEYVAILAEAFKLRRLCADRQVGASASGLSVGSTLIKQPAYVANDWYKAEQFGYAGILISASYFALGAIRTTAWLKDPAKLIVRNRSLIFPMTVVLGLIGYFSHNPMAAFPISFRDGALTLAPQGDYGAICWLAWFSGMLEALMGVVKYRDNIAQYRNGTFNIDSDYAESLIAFCKFTAFGISYPIIVLCTPIDYTTHWMVWFLYAPLMYFKAYMSWRSYRATRKE